jgi:hypothetical protein
MNWEKQGNDYINSNTLMHKFASLISDLAHGSFAPLNALASPDITKTLMADFSIKHPCSKRHRTAVLQQSV